jgi:FkbM family methyltransferase
MILAIEPDKNNFTYLETLIENNSLANIELMNVAVADKSGNEVPLFMAESSSRNSLLGKDVVTGTQLIESQRVNTITLEDVLNKIGHVNYLKMDCEGAEFPIFQSANTRLFSDIYKIALEFHANESSPELRELISKMKSVYKFVSVTRTHPAMGYIYAKN